MTTLSRQLPFAERAGAAFMTKRWAAALRAQWWIALAAGVTAFFCMLPYPAYAIGSATALQIGNVCVIAACLPLLWTPRGGRTLLVYAMLVTPLLISLLVVALSGGDASLAFKAAVVWSLSLLALTFVQAYAPRFGLEILTGIAIATLIHAAVGVWQTYAFARDEFPLLGIYTNPSFLSVQEHADTIARWTKRPFGIFPEPSAMSASLSPWLLIWIGLLTGLLKLRQPLATVRRALFASAAISAVALMILSRSGQTAITLLVALGLCGMWLLRARATSKALAMVMLVSAVVLPAILWMAARSVGDRLGGGKLGNSSWEERAYSIETGFALFSQGDLKTLLFGFGPGLSAVEVTRQRGLESIWSVSLCYVYDTGFVGLAAVTGIALLLLRNGSRMRFDPVAGAVVLAWLVGVTLTTSYEQLLPLWMALGMFTVWPAVFEVDHDRRQTCR